MLKRIIAAIIVFAIVMTPVVALGAETAGQKAVREAGLSVEWINLGADFESAVGLGLFNMDSDGNIPVCAYMEDDSTKWIFFNGKGEPVSSTIFDYQPSFQDGLAYVELNGKKMLIDIEGNVKLDLSKYDRAITYDHELVVVRQNEKIGLIDMVGEEVLPCIYDDISLTRNGLIEVMNQTSKFGLFDRTGKPVTEIEYTSITTYGEGDLIIVNKGEKYGFVNKTGQVVIPLKYGGALRCGENIYAVSVNGKWGCINDKSEEIAPFQFDWIDEFYEGLAIVSMDGKRGFIDTSGKIVILCKYYTAGRFIDGVASVLMIVDGIHYNYLIDINGETIIGPKEYGLEIRDRLIARYYAGIGTNIMPPNNYSNMEALLDAEGNRLTEYYYLIQEFKDGLALVQHNDWSEKYGMINQYGTEIVPAIFNNIVVIDANTCFVSISEQLNAEGNTNSRIGILKLSNELAEKKPVSGRPITVYIDGLDLYFDSEPIIVNDRTMVPMRKIFENLGAEVSWDNDAKKVTAVRDNVTIELTIGNDIAFTNGEAKKLDAPAIIQDNRTLVPLRFVAETLNCDVSWDGANRRVVIATAD